MIYNGGENLEIKSLPEAVQINAETEEVLHKYAKLLLVMNENIRLVGPRDEETLWEAHICNCLNLLPLMPENGTVVDIGTGGGLPGAVLAICRHDLDFVLIDSVAKKINALTEILRKLSLKNVHAMCIRSEDLAMDYREKFTCATVSAVSEAGVIAEYMSPLVKVGGTLLAMKGGSVTEELAAVHDKWRKLGLSEPLLYKYVICEHPNYILMWKKASPCPPRFPRQAGKAVKNPWWK